MKRIFRFLIIVTCLGPVSAAMSQQKDSSYHSNNQPSYSKEYFLKKSENKKRAGQIFLIGGATLATGGVFVVAQKTDNFWLQLGNLLLGGTMIGVGITSGLVSIPFFIRSSQFKKKAAAVSLTNIPLQSPEVMNRYYGNIPSVSVSVSF